MISLTEQIRKRTEEIQDSPKDLEKIIGLQQLLKDRPNLNLIPNVEYESHGVWYLGSNEPKIEEHPHFKHGRFSLVGCGVLRSVEAIFSLIDFSRYQFNDDGIGYHNVPKLYAVDYSVNVMTAWQRLKEACIGCNDVWGFINKIPELYDGLRYQGKKEYLVGAIARLCDTPERFNLFKQIVAKATFILGDWNDKKIFNYLKKQVSDMPVAIYASNIHETVTYSNFKQSGQAVEGIVEAIAFLDPVVTIYAITSPAVYEELGGFMPDKMIFQKGNDVKSHMHALSDNGNAYLAKYICKQDPPKCNEPYLSGFEGFLRRKLKSSGVKLSTDNSNSQAIDGIKEKKKKNKNSFAGFAPGFLGGASGNSNKRTKDKQNFAGFTPGFLGGVSGNSNTRTKDKQNFAGFTTGFFESSKSKQKAPEKKNEEKPCLPRPFEEDNIFEQMSEELLYIGLSLLGMDSNEDDSDEAQNCVAHGCQSPTRTARQYKKG